MAENVNVTLGGAPFNGQPGDFTRAKQLVKTLIAGRKPAHSSCEVEMEEKG